MTAFQSDFEDKERQESRSIPGSEMVVALTGGSGRVGRAVRAELAGQVKGILIIDLVQPETLGENETWIATDICNLDAMVDAFQGVDGIVHLASYPSERCIEDILRVNVLGTHNVYEAARRAKVSRVVYGSSNHVVGFYPRDTCVGTDDQMRPDTLYGLSKCWGELEAGLYYEKFGIRTLNLRIGNAAARPADKRSLAVWVSPRDIAQLILIGLEHPDIQCTTVFGVSGTDANWWDNHTAEALGYRPLDSALSYAAPEAFNGGTSPVPEIADYFQGGRFCVIDHDGNRRRRRLP